MALYPYVCVYDFTYICWNEVGSGMEYTDLIKQYAELEKYASGAEEGEYIWVFYRPVYLKFHRAWKKQMKVGCRGGGTRTFKRSKRARSRRFVYRWPLLLSNDYFEKEKELETKETEADM